MKGYGNFTSSKEVIIPLAPETDGLGGSGGSSVAVGSVFAVLALVVLIVVFVVAVIGIVWYYRRSNTKRELKMYVIDLEKKGLSSKNLFDETLHF